ncbi:hypothetical protein J437_LFUL014660 [Ladona fulva]|uniref:PiggyBac transposable element-derived protein domain-containing protein n=1 Tax=Ladona fulva TaxID=123851 RepID=A0A8K0KHE5_LADFU|nr:hypothetical protein J437_LFUL014660 [Ladona fulva]
MGMLIIMGFHRVLSSVTLFWSQDENVHVEIISKVMTVKRFLKVLRHLHINDNTEMPRKNDPGFDKLYKISPLVDHMNITFMEMFNPSTWLAVDESMVKFKGRSSLKQYLSMEPIKRGFKIWAICDSMTGCALGLKIYKGKGGNANCLPLGERVIMELESCGTIRSNRKGFPTDKLKKDAELARREHDFVQAGDVSIVKWKDRSAKPVCVIS